MYVDYRGESWRYVLRAKECKKGRGEVRENEGGPGGHLTSSDPKSSDPTSSDPKSSDPTSCDPTNSDLTMQWSYEQRSYEQRSVDEASTKITSKMQVM